MDVKTIDSITILSNKLKEGKKLTPKQVNDFAADWNESESWGYYNKPFDSAFYISPAYQYRIEVFSKGKSRKFYGYNMIILDSTNWKYRMDKGADYNYFERYWKN